MFCFDVLAVGWIRLLVEFGCWLPFMAALQTQTWVAHFFWPWSCMQDACPLVVYWVQHLIVGCLLCFSTLTLCLHCLVPLFRAVSISEICAMMFLCLSCVVLVLLWLCGTMALHLEWWSTGAAAIWAVWACNQLRHSISVMAATYEGLCFLSLFHLFLFSKS